MFSILVAVAAGAAAAAARGAALVALGIAAVAALLLHALVLGAAVLEPDFDLSGRETHKLQLSSAHLSAVH